MTGVDRAALAEQALAGYPYGRGAPQAAEAIARRRLVDAEACIIVEGISDQIAVEVLAALQDRDLEADRVVVFPVGGAQAAANAMRELGPNGRDLRLAGLYDIDATETFRRAVTRAGIGRPVDGADLAALGFHPCSRDLEDELLRAVGAEAVLAVFESQGELGSFRTMQKQVEWRGHELSDQIHRFIRARATRSQRYARLLIEELGPDRSPAPLRSTLKHVYRSRRRA